MVEIKTVPIQSQLARELLALLKSEWPDLVEFSRFHLGMNLPEPLAAVASGKVVGGLSYTRYKAPDTDEMVLWINAVFVLPGYRGNGVASHLIKFALETNPCIYALTEVPYLYTQLGFERVEKCDDGEIVKFLKP